MADKKISVGIIGFGGRGTAMAKAIKALSEEIYVIAVADPDEQRRNTAITEYGVAAENTFSDYKKFLEKGVIADLLIISTMDKMHYEPAMMALEAGYKTIVLEKPISTDKDECINLTRAAKKNDAKIIIVHTLRYNPYFRKMREVVASGEIGEVIGVRHVEGASLINYTHSFVRGNFANTERSAPFVLQKSCHDIDILSYITGLNYKKICSLGSLGYFTEANAPQDCAERCSDCKYKDECRFSGYLLYSSPGHKPWYEGAVTLHGYSSVEESMEKSEYGRCVFKCDNNVMDHQALAFEFENGATGTFSLTAFEFGRRTEIQGTHYVMRCSEHTGLIELFNQIGGALVKTYDVRAEITTTIDHYSCDVQLMKDILDYFKKGITTELSFIEGALHSHLVCFASEVSRLEERMVYIKELAEDLE